MGFLDIAIVLTLGAALISSQLPSKKEPPEKELNVGAIEESMRIDLKQMKQWLSEIEALEIKRVVVKDTKD